ncbi:MAG: M20/M25/M40 family metallo-hydrolase [Candidatus Freyarchaeota archaeon]|nr:M20/M25/M40 family metallo-hydrolase [Candidatus Jordarchaeia archaeon]
MVRTDESYEKLMFDYVKNICEEFGPREHCSPAEVEALKKTGKILEEYCDSVEVEEYECHPRGFLGYIRWFIWFYVAALLLYWTDWAWWLGVNPASLWFLSILGAAMIAFAFTVLFLQLMYLAEFVDPVFPKKRSLNVVGKLKPEGKAERLVILGGHVDSAYEFTLSSKFGRGSYVIMVAGIVASASLMVMAALKFIGVLLMGYPAPSWPTPIPALNTIIYQFSSVLKAAFGAFDIQLVLWLVGAVFVFLVSYFFVNTRRLALGANDDLAGVAAIIGAAKYLSQNRPKRTEVWIVAFGNEESMRGSKRFVEKHYRELAERRAYTVNVEMVGCGSPLVASTAEPMFLAKHSPEVYELLAEAGKVAGIPVKVGAMPFGGTDSANFSRKGLPASALLRIGKETESLWHTPKDTLENVDAGKIREALEVLLEFVNLVDKKK